MPRPPDHAERGAHDGAPTESLCSTLARKCSPRLAEEGDRQITEAERWLDSLDVVMLDALGGGSYSLADAIEFTLVGHGRIRRHLGAALVAVG